MRKRRYRRWIGRASTAAQTPRRTGDTLVTVPDTGSMAGADLSAAANDICWNARARA